MKRALLPLFALAAAAVALRPAPARADAAEDALRRWVAVPERYADRDADASLPVALGLFGGACQTGLVEDDVTALRFGLASHHHNVGVLDFNLAYARSDGRQRGVQFGGVNVVEGPLRGVQLGWLGNGAGVLEGTASVGAQIALLGNYADSLRGAQAGLLFNRNCTGTGLQLALLCNFSDTFRGLQIGGVNLDGEDVRGVQFGVLNAGAKRFSGLQIGALNGCRGEAHGLQLSLFNSASDLHGVQLGLFNLATESNGWQIGLYNDARVCRGVQIGLLNYASDGDLPLLPFFRAAF